MHEPRCILVVEDNREVRRMMQVALTLRGYDVRAATSASEAFEILATGEPNLLILDLMLPLVSGWDVLGIRATIPSLLRIPTIVVTATDAYNQVDAAKHGVFAVLRKPFEPASLQNLAASGLHAFAEQRGSGQ